MCYRKLREEPRYKMFRIDLVLILKLSMIWYEIEYFSFLIIAVLF